MAGGAPDPVLAQKPRADSAVTGITQGIVTEISVDSLALPAIAGTAIRGRIFLSTVDGHFPSGDDQIGLGVTTMRQAGAHLGSVVRVTVSLPSGGRRTVPFQVVSQVSFPVLGGVVSLGSGAVLTIAGYEDTMCPPDPKQATCRLAALEETGGGGILVSVVSGPRGLAAIRHYLDTYQSITALPITPVSLVNFGEAVNFPLIFGAMLALFGAATLASSARGECVAPQTRNRAFEGTGLRERPDCLRREPGRPQRWRSSGS